MNAPRKPPTPASKNSLHPEVTGNRPKWLPALCAVRLQKIDTEKCGDRSARDRAAPTDSRDDSAYSDRAAARGTARHTGDERGDIFRSRSRQENCLNRTGYPADRSEARGYDRRADPRG